MNQTQRMLLDQIQSHFPLTTRPFRDIGQRLGISESRVRTEIAALTRRGVIRRIGAVVCARHAGYHTVLVAAAVAPRRVAQVARRLNRREEITHNFLRPGPYNIWFTLHAATRSQLRGLIRHIRSFAGIEKMLVLPAEQAYKIRAVFPLEAGGRHGCR